MFGSARKFWSFLTTLCCVIAVGLGSFLQSALVHAVELVIDPPVDLAVATADVKTALEAPTKLVYGLLAGFLVLAVIWALLSRGARKHATKS